VGAPPAPPPFRKQHIVLVSNILNLAIFVGKKMKK